MRWFWQKPSGYELMVEFGRLGYEDNAKTVAFVQKHLRDFPKEKRVGVYSVVYQEICETGGHIQGRRFIGMIMKAFGSEEVQKVYARANQGKPGIIRRWIELEEAEERAKRLKKTGA